MVFDVLFCLMKIMICGEYKIEIKAMDKEAYVGKKFTAHYKTNGYYDIYADTSGFCMKYVPLEKSEEKSFDDEFFWRMA